MDVMGLRRRLLLLPQKPKYGDIYAGAEKTDGKTLSVNGEVVNEVEMVVTDFIKIVPNTAYDITVTAGTTGSRTRRFICYDSNYTFIEQLKSWAWLNSGQTVTASILIPSNAVYLRVCNYNADILSVIGNIP